MTEINQQHLSLAVLEPRSEYPVERLNRRFGQLSLLIGYDALRKLHKDTQNAVLLSDLVKEAA
ncbi:hypothetical protein [Pseudomonas moraviensis]|uniref:hypothetical protein n=1 Tax=Pseudomonas moraviensis TaxID=321662 RepID=UPI0038B4B099